MMGKYHVIKRGPFYKLCDRSYCIGENSFYFLGEIIHVLSEDSIEVEHIGEKLHIFKAHGGWFVNHVIDEEKGGVYWTEDLWDRSKWKKVIREKVRLAPSIRDINGGFGWGL